MTEGTAKTISDPSAQSIGTGPLAHSVPCDSCDYNLRGLPPDGMCPECGHPIAASVRHWRNRGALTAEQRRWLIRTRSGMNMLLLGPFLGVPLFIGLTALAAAGSPAHFIIGVAVVVASLLYLFLAVAIWLATTPMPDERGTGTHPFPTLIARTASVLGIGLATWQLAAPSAWANMFQCLVLLVCCAMVLIQLSRLAKFLRRRIMPRLFLILAALLLFPLVGTLSIILQPDTTRFLIAMVAPVLIVAWFCMLRLSNLIVILLMA